MGKDYGKKFENKFKEDFLRSVPNSIVTRLYDQVSGFHGSSNICDFICYSYPNIFYIECKTHFGASLPLDNITQYDGLKPLADIKGAIAGVVLWLYDKDIVLFIPITTIIKLKEAGEKSVGIRSIAEGYAIIEIPGNKKRVFIDSDYSCLLSQLP